MGTALVLRLGSANGSFSANFAERRPADERFGVRTTFTLLSASISVTELLIRTFCLPRRMLVDLWRFYGITGECEKKRVQLWMLFWRRQTFPDRQMSRCQNGGDDVTYGICRFGVKYFLAITQLISGFPHHQMSDSVQDGGKVSLAWFIRGIGEI